MHLITVTALGVHCSCGFDQPTITGAEAHRIGYSHASANAPALLTDARLIPIKEN